MGSQNTRSAGAAVHSLSAKTPLLGRRSQKRSSFSVFITSPFRHFYTFTKGLFKTSTDVVKSIIALTSSLYNGFYAIAPAPENIADDWGDMSVGSHINTVLRPLSAISVNTPLNKYFLDNAPDRFKKKDKPKGKFSSISYYLLEKPTAIVGSISSALAVGALTSIKPHKLLSKYLGNWAYIPVGILVVVTSPITLTSRYLGIKNLFRRVRYNRWFDKKAKAQSDAARIFRHLKLEYLIGGESIEDRLNRVTQETIARLSIKNKALSHGDYEAIFMALMAEIKIISDEIKGSPESIFQPESREIKSKVLYTLQGLSALFIGALTASVFMEKGFEGFSLLINFGTWAINKVAKHAAGVDLNLGLTITNVHLQRVIGSPAAIASGMLYASSTMDFPNLLLQAVSTTIFTHPSKYTLSFALQAAANIYAMSSMINTTVQVYNGNYQGMLGLLKETAVINFIAPYVVGLGALFVNWGPTLGRYTPELDQVKAKNVFNILEHSATHAIKDENETTLTDIINKVGLFGRDSGSSIENGASSHESYRPESELSDVNENPSLRESLLRQSRQSQ